MLNLRYITVMLRSLVVFMHEKLNFLMNLWIFGWLCDHILVKDDFIINFKMYDERWQSDVLVNVFTLETKYYYLWVGKYFAIHIHMEDNMQIILRVLLIHFYGYILEFKLWTNMFEFQHVYRLIMKHINIKIFLIRIR